MQMIALLSLYITAIDNYCQHAAVIELSHRVAQVLINIFHATVTRFFLLEPLFTDFMLIVSLETGS
jgi:hypothetical protein